MNQAHPSAAEEPAPGPRPPLVPATARELALDAQARAVFLVEGWSDQAVIETLARRRGWDLRAEGILTPPIGGGLACASHGKDQGGTQRMIDDGLLLIGEREGHSARIVS